ncbi:MFS transporter [archaeon]|nr:MAG: MFS transporter [archaeon]
MPINLLFLLYLQMLFTVATFFSFLGPLLLGIVLDYYGPRICSLLSITFVTLGCILFSMSDIKSSPWFIPAVCLIAFGGPGAQSAIIHLSNLFPIWKGTATAIITGSFQLSFVVFLIFDQLWQHYQLSYKKLFLSYCVVCVVNALVSLTLWPDEPYSYEEVVIADDIPDPEEQLVGDR